MQAVEMIESYISTIRYEYKAFEMSIICLESSWQNRDTWLENPTDNPKT